MCLNVISLVQVLGLGKWAAQVDGQEPHKFAQDGAAFTLGGSHAGLSRQQHKSDAHGNQVCQSARACMLAHSATVQHSRSSIQGFSSFFLRFFAAAFGTWQADR